MQDLSTFPIDSEEQKILNKARRPNCPKCGKTGRAARMDAVELAASPTNHGTVTPESLAHAHGKLYGTGRLICYSCQWTWN